MRAGPVTLRCSDTCGGLVSLLLFHLRYSTSQPAWRRTPHGQSRYPRDWHPVLKAVARLNFLWEHVTPDDLVAFLDVCRDMGCQPGAPLSVDVLVVIFAAHTLKWPPAVRQWSQLVRGRPPTDARGVMALYRDVLSWCDGKDWPRGHRQSVGIPLIQYIHI